MADDEPWAFQAGRLTARTWQRARQVADAARRMASDAASGRARDPGRDPEMAEWYANLELPYGADLEAVHRARKRLLARYHPDRYATDPDAAHRAHELVLAIHHAHAQLVKRLSR